MLYESEVVLIVRLKLSQKGGRKGKKKKRIPVQIESESDAAHGADHSSVLQTPLFNVDPKKL